MRDLQSEAVALKKKNFVSIGLVLTFYFPSFKVWNHYDQDRSGFIESDELRVRLKTATDISKFHIKTFILLRSSSHEPYFIRILNDQN